MLRVLGLSLLFAAMVGAQEEAADLVVGVGETEAIAVEGFPRHEVIQADKLGVELKKDQVLLHGREIGQATLILWDAGGRTRRYRVRIVAPGEVSRQREQDIRAALAADPLTRDQRISVQVEAGRATLTGQVSDVRAKDRAVELARARCPQVADQLTVAAAPAGEQPAARPPAPELPPLPAPAGRTEPLPALPPRPQLQIDETQQNLKLELAVHEARLVTVPTELQRALIADDSIADVVPIPPREVAVIAKSAGDTTLMIWYRGDDPFLGEVATARIDVRVIGEPAAETRGLPGSEEIDRLLKLLGLEGIQVLTSHDAAAPSVLLLGTVNSPSDVARAEQGLRALLPENVRLTNLIEVKRQPALSPAELARRAESLEKLLAEQLPNAAIRVRTRMDEGAERIRVYLSGEAAVPSDRLRAEQLVAFELGPNAMITNDIVTPLPPPPAELLDGAGAEEPPKPPLSEALAEALKASGVFHERVYLDVFEDRKLVVVRGQVRNDEEQQSILDVVNEVVGQYGEGFEIRDRGLQVKQPRIVTEVKVVELSAVDAQNLGVVWGTPISTGGAGGGGGGGTNQGATTISNTNGALTVYGERVVGDPFRRIDPLAASIRALEQENRAKVLQRPTITADDGQQGLVEIVTEVPLPSTTTGTGGTTGVSVEFRPVGIRLQVTPQVVWGDSENRIEMDILSEVSAVDFGISVNIGGSVIPAITNRQATTVVTVGDGETLVIGGLTTESERKNVSRLPFLGDLPIIGSLFRYTDSKKEQTTVVVVMTPRIQW